MRGRRQSSVPDPERGCSRLGDANMEHHSAAARSTKGRPLAWSTATGRSLGWDTTNTICDRISAPTP